MVDPAAFKRKA
jgi:hypothetical protein